MRIRCLNIYDHFRMRARARTTVGSLKAARRLRGYSSSGGVSAPVGQTSGSAMN